MVLAGAARCSGPLLVLSNQIGAKRSTRGALSQPLGHWRQLAGSPLVRPQRRDVRRLGWLAGDGAWPAHASDPDAYEEDVEDEDDYREGELMGGGPVPAASAPAPASGATAVTNGFGGGSSGRSNGFWSLGAGATAASGGSTSGSSAVGGEAEQAPEPPNQSRQVGEALQDGYQLLLVFAAAVQRLLQRLHIAVLATVRVAWQLGRDAVRGLRHNAVEAKSQAGDAFVASPAGKKVENWRRTLDAAQQEWPEDLWGKVMWVWDRPPVQKLRLTISMANFSIRLPALVALVATQVGLLSTSLSLPMLAPLLLGTGMLLRSIRTNASLIFPRIGLLVVLLWLLWFANSVIQNTVTYLRKQGAVDQRLANNVNSVAELTVLVTAAVILLSMLGVNVSALLLPAGVLAAIASRDLSHNFLAGFFLMMVQPFRLGDRVGVSLPSGSPGSFGAGSWFEGVCEKVDLRYTSLRQGKRRLMVPNSAFLQQPFMIMEDVPQPQDTEFGRRGAKNGSANGSGGDAGAGVGTQPYSEPFVWQQYMDGAPVHEELAREAAGQPAGWPPGQAPQPEQQQQQQQAGPQPWQPAGPGQSHSQHPQQQQQQPGYGVPPAVPQYQQPQYQQQQVYEYQHEGSKGPYTNGRHPPAPGSGQGPPRYNGGAPPGYPMPPSPYL